MIVSLGTWNITLLRDKVVKYTKKASKGSNCILNILQIYAPAEDTEEEKMTEFHTKMHLMVDRIREENNTIINLRDQKAKIGNGKPNSREHWTIKK